MKLLAAKRRTPHVAEQSDDVAEGGLVSVVPAKRSVRALRSNTEAAKAGGENDESSVW